MIQQPFKYPSKSMETAPLSSMADACALQLKRSTQTGCKDTWPRTGSGANLCASDRSIWEF